MNELADLIFPNIDKTVADYEKMYPARELKEGTIVTRFAPSPTGFIHIGHLFSSFVAKKVAQDTDGIFYLRIEDTDQKRTVENGITNIIRDLKNYNITFNEGMISETEEIGNYGPYIQSKRKEIYQTFAKELLKKGLAYPCFCTEEEVNDVREIQKRRKDRIGYYGEYAKYRNFDEQEAIKKIKNNEPYVVRFKSMGDYNKKIEINDAIKGKLTFPENDLDIVIIKSDGLPTYHFAHFVDDYLMHTTHIIRSDEWISSLPIHIQLFKTFNVKPPKYAHLSPLMKIDETGSKRKLSKRKDPESAVSYYHEKGIPKEAVILYILTVANSNFEAWYDTNKDASIDDFKFDFKKVSSSGSLFDYDKLLNISKNYISRLTAKEVYDGVLEYAKEFDLEFYNLLTKYKDYSIKIFNIEREQKKPRKDYDSYGNIKDQVFYMYDELFSDVTYDFDEKINKEEIKKVLDSYIEIYDENDDKDTWFSKMQNIGDNLGYCSNIKQYKENPDNYKGSIADISNIIRVAVTTSRMSPDLYEILKLLGKDRIKDRFNKAIQKLENK